MKNSFLPRQLLQHKLLFLLCIFFSALYLYFFINQAYVEITIDSPEATLFKIYWAEKDQPYSEKNRTQLRVVPEQKKYSFYLTDIADIVKLRIDPHQHRGVSTIKKITIHQPGFKPLHLETIADFSQLTPLFGVIEYGIDKHGLFTKSLGNDPQFELIYTPEKTAFNLPLETARIAAICLLVWLLYHLGAPLTKNLQYVPVFLAVIFALIALMATTSAENSHPDEYVHIAAARYYQDHWMPPHIDAPDIRHTYSVYGFSRLNSGEISYLLTGKFSNLLAPLHLPNYQAFRIFNITLFGIMLLIVIFRPQIRPLILPLLLTPQLWYVFSYYDSDGFAIFVYFLACYQILLPDSSFNTLTRRAFSCAMLPQYFLLATLCALLFLAKKNYYILLAFLFFYYFWKNWYISKALTKAILVRSLFIILIGLCIAGTRKASDYVINGLDRTKKIEAIRELTAQPLYKPSTELNKKHGHLYMKSRGHSLKRIIQVERWGAKTFRSAFGVYGYFTLIASDNYYTVVKWMGSAFLLFFVATIFLRGGVNNSILLFVGLSICFALIGISLWHSWTADFQAQGRYLFPIILIPGVIYYYTQDLFHKTTFTFFTLNMFFISLYSFLFIALKYIPKHILL